MKITNEGISSALDLAALAAQRKVPTVQGAYGVRISADSVVAKRWPLGLRIRTPDDVECPEWLTVTGYSTSAYQGVTALWLGHWDTPVEVRVELSKLEAVNGDWREPDVEGVPV